MVQATVFNVLHQFRYVYIIAWKWTINTPPTFNQVCIDCKMRQDKVNTVIYSVCWTTLVLIFYIMYIYVLCSNFRRTLQRPMTPLLQVVLQWAPAQMQVCLEESHNHLGLEAVQNKKHTTSYSILHLQCLCQCLQIYTLAHFVLVCFRSVCCCVW